MGISAAEFDQWYAERVTSPVADELARRVLGLPPDLPSTSLLTGDGLDEVVAALGLRAGQVLLDLACGRGGYGMEIARRCDVRLVGVDFSAVAIGQARDRARRSAFPDRVAFWVGELTRTGLATGSVDAVLIVDAIQFAGSIPDALRECRRVLVPGGRVAITCWEADDRADDRLPERLRQVDLARQLPQAGFLHTEVTDKPAWQQVERTLWQEAIATDAGDDPAVRSMRDEGRRILSIMDGIRRVMATASAPG